MDDGPSHDDAQDDDEDLRSDPMAQIDLGVSISVAGERNSSMTNFCQQHITGVLRQCYASNANGMHEMIGALTDDEKGILRSVLTL